jgi:hypothetical protein
VTTLHLNARAASVGRTSQKNARRAVMELLERREVISATALLMPLLSEIHTATGSLVPELSVGSTPGSSTALPAPVALSPGSAISPHPLPTTGTLTPTFMWQAVSDVTFTGFQINLYDQTTGKFVSFLPVGTAITSYTIPTNSALTAGDSYVWNLRLLNGTASGRPSIYLNFVAGPVAAATAPVALTPGSAVLPGPVVTTPLPTFTWTAATGSAITGYQINIFDITTSTLESELVGASVTSDTLDTPLAPGNNYIWNVRAVDGTASGPPSNYLSFQTAAAAALPAPVATSPGSSVAPGSAVTTLTPTFSWNAVTGAALTGYQINIFNVTTSTLVSAVVGASVTSYTPTTPLSAGGSYVWNVRALDGTTSGPPSAYRYFQTPAVVTLPAPVATSPGSSASPGAVLTTFTPTFTWQAVTGVSFTGYQVNIYNVTTKALTTQVVGASVTSYTPTTPLAAGNSYVWHVRVLNGTASGPSSNYLFFQTPVLPAPVILGPGGSTAPGTTLTTLTPTFTWEAVTGVTFDTYQINLYDITKKVMTTIQVANTQTSYTLPAGTLIAGDDYVWNLRLKSGTTTGLESLPYLYFVAL